MYGLIQYDAKNIHGAYMHIFEHIWTYIHMHEHIPALSGWWALPAALRRPQKKHAPGFLEHVSCGFSRCLSIFVDFRSPKWYQYIGLTQHIPSDTVSI